MAQLITTTIYTELQSKPREGHLRRYCLLGRTDQPKDKWRNQARSAIALLTNVQIITTDSILIEVLNFFAEHGNEARRRAVSVVEELLTSPIIEVVPQTRDNFLAGLTFYKARADKGYSLTDCISMITMRERNITEVLTHDHHFGQEGFTVLF